MDNTPSLLSAGLAILSALLYLVAVWRQVLNLEAGEDRQRQQIALVGAPLHWPPMRSQRTFPRWRENRAWDSIVLPR